jgi:hypothetical protein
MREYSTFKVLKIGGETGQGSGFHAAFHAKSCFFSIVPFV